MAVILLVLHHPSMTLPVGSSAPGGTVQASPAELQKAGRGFQALSNGFGGMAGTPDLQNGGQVEVEALAFPGVTQFQLPSGLHDDLMEITQRFLGVLLAGRVQFADAAVDLFQVAGDFRTADGEIPRDARRAPPSPYVPTGITEYRTPSGQVYFKDPSGTVVADPGARPGGPVEPTGNPYEKVVGQTYHPARSS